MTVERSVVEVAGLEMHVRSAGDGAPVLLIHQCPRSSLELEPLLTELARLGRRAHAIDLPGFGGSEPLRHPRPSIQDIAEHVAGTVRALGIAGCPVYGMHTGAKVALQLALRQPDTVSTLVLDGLSMNPPGDGPGEGYFAGFTPRQDGAHLAELWCRERDQYRFFPWNRATPDARLPWPAADAETIQAHLLDLLLAGPDFGRTYRAPYAYDAREAITRVEVPTQIVCREDDLLASHLDRLPPLPSGCHVRRLPPDTDAWRDAVARALVVPAGCATAPVNGELGVRPHRRRLMSTSIGRHAVYDYASPHAVTLLALPPLPGAAATDAALYAALAPHGRVLAVDLPGCADAAPLPPGANPYEATAIGLTEVLDALQLREVIVFAPEHTHGIAMALAARDPARIRRVVLDGGTLPRDACAHAVDALPSVAPELSGAHLLRAWHWLRDQSLAWPWYDRRASAVRRAEPGLDALRLHTALVGLLKAPASALAFWTALWQCADRAPACAPVPTTRLIVDGDPGGADTSPYAAHSTVRGAGLPGLQHALERMLRGAP
jgi:pimeloyl-ACP methyl ester carboxylesterase